MPRREKTEIVMIYCLYDEKIGAVQEKEEKVRIRKKKGDNGWGI